MNAVPGVVSVHEWQGQVEQVSEAMLVIKVSQGLSAQTLLLLLLLLLLYLA